MNRYAPDTTPSCGAIVVQDGHALLVTSGKGLSFPKGHMEAGETPEQTAEREVLEETGIRIQVLAGFRGIVPSSRPGDMRTVTFFLGRSLEGRKTPVPCEVPEALWVPVPEVESLILFGPDRQLWLDALAYLQKHPGMQDAT